MIRPDEEPDEKWEVFGRFLEELQSAVDVENILRRYCEAHPAWTREFREEAVMNRVLDEARPDSALADPTLLEDFRVVRRIASGGMGVVYEAEQLTLRRRVALKVRHGVDSPERRAAFEHEQHVLAHLHHSNIVPIHHSGRCGERQFFAMAFIDGPSLHHVLRRAWRRASRGEPVPGLLTLIEDCAEAPAADDPERFTKTVRDLTVRTVEGVQPAGVQPQGPVRLPAGHFQSMAALIADAAEAVSHAHAAMIVHRDIKPSNIMLDAAGQCWLIDFGLAATADRGTSEPGRPAGTPGYIAPERLDANGSPFSTQSDLWSLGATMFEALTLRRPDSPGASIEALAPDVPPDLAAICRKAMLPPDRRYETAMDLANDLHCWMEGRPTSARPIRIWRRAGLWCRRNKGWAAALAAGGMLLVGAIAFWILHADHRAEQAELRSRVAESEAAEEHRIALIRERDSWLMDAQRLPGTDPRNGWFPRAWSLLERANAVQSDAKVRDLAVAALREPDAEPVRIFPFGGSSFAFDPRGERVLIGGWTDPKGRRVQPAKLWTPGTDRFADSSRMGDGPVAFTRGGRLRQLIRDPGSLVLWDMDSKTELWRAGLSGDPLDETALALSADGDLIAASAEFDDRPRTRIWRSSSEAPVVETSFQSSALAISPDGEFVAMADAAARRVVIHSVSAGKAVAELPSESLPVAGLAFGRNPKPCSDPIGRWLVATGDAGGGITIWNLRSRLPLSQCRGMVREVKSLAFHPDGTLLAAGGRGDVRLWDVAAAKPCLDISPKQGLDYVTQLAFSPDGGTLGISSLGVFYPPTVSVWRIDDRRGLRTLRGFTGQVEKIVVSPDNRLVAALAQNWTAGIWDLASGHLLHIVDVPAGVYADNAALAFSRSSRELACSVATPAGTKVVLIDAASGAEQRRWELPPGLQNSMACDESGGWVHFQVELERSGALPLAQYSWQEHPRVGRIRALSGASPQKPVATAQEFARHVYVARLAPDARSLVIDGIDRDGNRSIKVLRCDSGRVAATFAANQRAPSSDLTLDADGRAVWVSDNASIRRIQLPDGPDQKCPGLSVLAANSSASLFCCRYDGEEAGCLLARAAGGARVANLSTRVPLNAATFDPSGRRVILGTPEGRLIVCELPEIQARLQSLGFPW